MLNRHKNWLRRKSKKEFHAKSLYFDKSGPPIKWKEKKGAEDEWRKSLPFSFLTKRRSKTKSESDNIKNSNLADGFFAHPKYNSQRNSCASLLFTFNFRHVYFWLGLKPVPLHQITTTLKLRSDTRGTPKKSAYFP